MVAFPVIAAEPAVDRFRGSSVEWTRLVTGHPNWNRHAVHDVRLLTLMRTHTALNISDQWRATNPGNLEELCNYPFVYADNIRHLNETGIRNLGEYIRRGGFLFIDACISGRVNPSAEGFLQAQLKILATQFPDLRTETLAPDHEIFSVYFKMTKFPPQTRTFTDGNWADGPTLPLRALYSNDRMIGILSLSGFQCGWGLISDEKNAIECIQMVTNIYLYAMTRANAPAPSR